MIGPETKRLADRLRAGQAAARASLLANPNTSPLQRVIYEMRQRAALSDDAQQPTPPRTRKHRPTLASVKRQAVRAGITVARYEHRPDGTIVVVPGTPTAITDTDDTTNLDPKWN